MSYASFLAWIIANASKFKRLLELLGEVAELFKPAAQEGQLGLTEAITLDSDVETSDEILDLEASAVVALADAGGNTQAVFDGSRLRKLFEVIGPLLPVLLKLFGVA